MKLESLKLIIVLCLCILLVGLLATDRTDASEGFENVDTKVCGTAGFKPSEATFKAIKLFGIGKDFSKERLYTKSECNKLDKGTYRDLECINGTTSYNALCGGLNSTIQSPAPTECKVDGVVLGKPSVAFTQTINGKQEVIENNAAQLYTENECKLLKGDKFIKLGDMMKSMNALPDEIPKAIQLNGENYGLCFNRDTIYSAVCTVDAAPSMGADVANAAKKHLTSWLK
jgi:hypothetical protein